MKEELCNFRETSKQFHFPTHESANYQRPKTKNCIILSLKTLTESFPTVKIRNNFH